MFSSLYFTYFFYAATRYIIPTSSKSQMKIKMIESIPTCTYLIERQGTSEKIQIKKRSWLPLKCSHFYVTLLLEQIDTSQESRGLYLFIYYPLGTWDSNKCKIKYPGSLQRHQYGRGRLTRFVFLASLLHRTQEKKLPMTCIQFRNELFG